MEQILPHIQMNAMKNSESDLRRVAYSSLEVSLAVMSEYVDYDGALYSPAQGWNDPLGFAGISFPDAEVTVDFIDESGKLPFSSLYQDSTTFLVILSDLGFDDYTATELVDKFQDWVDEDDLVRPDGAENDFYLDAPIPYEPANQPISSLRELALIGGFREEFFDINGRPTQLYYSFEALFSAVNEGSVNINTADSALFSLGEDGTTYEQMPFWEFLMGDDGVRGTADDRYFSNTSQVPESLKSAIPGVTVSNKMEWINIIIRAKRGLSVFELRALVSMNGQFPSNLNTGFDRFHREEPAFSIEDNAERSQEIRNLTYPFVVVEIQENEIVL
ncbi:MAG: type II secretion system protein GspK [Verrucomicrobia bacterium]|nr:type II secretion system protein GspK [Verrucomicrobiota bacterium]